MARACAELQCGVVLMHTRGRPSEWRTLPRLAQNEVVPLVRSGLAESLATAITAGIDRTRIVLDPGFGFGKAFDNNYPLLAHFDELLSLGQPLLAGVSRKSFLARTLSEIGAENPVSDRGHCHSGSDHCGNSCRGVDGPGSRCSTGGRSRGHCRRDSKSALIRTPHHAITSSSPSWSSAGCAGFFRIRLYFRRNFLGELLPAHFLAGPGRGLLLPHAAHP